MTQLLNCKLAIDKVRNPKNRSENDCLVYEAYWKQQFETLLLPVPIPEKYKHRRTQGLYFQMLHLCQHSSERKMTLRNLRLTLRKVHPEVNTHFSPNVLQMRVACSGSMLKSKRKVTSQQIAFPFCHAIPRISLTICVGHDVRTDLIFQIRV